MQLLKRIPSRDLYLSSIRKSENHIILIRIVYIGKHRVTNKAGIALVSLVSLVTLIALVTFISLISGRLAELIPSFTIVVRNVPIVVLDFELRGNSILAIFSVSTISSVSAVSSVLTILTILTIGTICTVCAVCAICSILAVGTLGLNFVAIIVKQPLAVECPIVDTVSILLHANLRSVAVLTVYAILSVFAISTVLAILTVVDSDSRRLSEGNGITNSHTTLGNGRNTRNVVVLLQSINDTLQ